MNARAVAVIVGVAMSLSACAGGATEGTSPGPEAVGPQATPEVDDGGPTEEVVFARFGGLCVDGACRFELTLSDDGSWTLTEQLQPAGDGAIAAADALALIEAVDAAWDELSAQDFTGTCPTAYDGQELILLRSTYPNDPLADADRRTTSSCRFVWPDAPTQALREAVRSAGLPDW